MNVSDMQYAFTSISLSAPMYCASPNIQPPSQGAASHSPPKKISPPAASGHAIVLASSGTPASPRSGK